MEDLAFIPLKLNSNQTPVLLKDVANIRFGPAPRRGIAEWNGTGETVGGIIVMRSGQDALTVINRVKAKIDQLKSTLPKGVHIEIAYDRSPFIRIKGERSYAISM